MANLLLVLNLPGLTKANLDTFIKSQDVFPDILNKLNGQAGMSFALNSSQPQVTVSTKENGTQATATVTCVTVANNSTVVIGNVTLTGKTSSPSGNAQFLCGVSATADAVALKNIINAHPTLSTWVVASNVAGVLTLTTLDYDTRGNAYALTSSDGTNLAVVGFASGAADAALRTVYT